SEVGIDTPILDPIDLIPTTAILRAIAKGSLLKFGAKETGEVLARESAEAVDTAQRIVGKDKGILKSGKGIDLTNPNTWPKPPVKGKVTVGNPSRGKPRARGEKSFFDENGGEWRPAKPDKYHDKGHWDYKAPGNNTPWQNIDE
ncbi:MAG: hypothetical protein KDD58_05500, partial [Bdellovibrionales bacterium]|nr:hypothetical protein [Bdellovibrionales bacterium]